MGLFQALQISGLILPAFRDTGMRLREAEKLAQGCTAPGILNETRPACECDFPFPTPVLRSLRQTTERARGGRERVFLPAFTARVGDTQRSDRSAGPKRRQNEDWRRRPTLRGTRCPGLSGCFLGTEPPESRSENVRGFRRRQGTVGFKLKIRARPQLSHQGPRPRAPARLSRSP